MNLSNFMGYVLPAVLVIAVTVATLVGYALSRRHQVKQKEEFKQSEIRAMTGSNIVESVRTNNSVPTLEKTFSGLIENLDAYDLKLNTDLRGYATDGE